MPIAPRPLAVAMATIGSRGGGALIAVFLVRSEAPGAPLALAG